MKFSSISNIGRVREINEDSYGNIAIENYDFFIVADGMGGHSDGELASSLAVKSFTDFVSAENPSDYESVVDFQEQAIFNANEAVFHMSKDKDEKMGTTVVCLCIDYKEKLYHISHIGDSRIYLFRAGILSQLTKDHSLVNELIDRGAIKEDEAQNFVNKSAVTRAVGVNEIAVSDYKSLEIEGNDIILMVTDGLTNELTDDQIVEVLSQEKDVFEISTRLVDEALASGGRDNITVTTIKM